MEFEVENRVKIKIGVFSGRNGKVEVINDSNEPEILYPIGVRLDPIPGEKMLPPLTWFGLDALEKVDL
jgi:hypothetical protein